MEHQPEFQFQYGAIKRILSQLYKLSYIVFQFQYGAIKSFFVGLKWQK